MSIKKSLTALISVALLGGCSSVPSEKPVDNIVWLEQNWTQAQRQWFHHASQGTQTIPISFEWFMALEQPSMTPWKPSALLSDQAYLANLGFISSSSSQYNQANLPIGLAVDYGAKNLQTGKTYNAIGFTCAACHTGHMTYQGTSIRYDGGAAMVNLAALTKSLFFSMAETWMDDERFERFAKRILKVQDTQANREVLYAEFSQTLLALVKAAITPLKEEDIKNIVAEIKQLREKDKIEKAKFFANVVKTARQTLKGLDTGEGFGRLDALNRIGNTVFSFDAHKPENLAPTNVPVNYPHIWTSSWFDWVQYDGSIMQPMVRNAGEALGTSADLNVLAGNDAYDSTVPVDTLFKIEDQLAGKDPYPAKRFNGLAAPKWPENILGKIDQDKAAQGKKLYDTNCASCHMPAIDTPEFWTETYWQHKNTAGERLLSMPMTAVDEIGTDPAQANVLQTRRVNTVGIDIETTIYDGECQPVKLKNQTNDTQESPLFAYALGAVVQKTVEHWYGKQGITDQATQDKIDGYRLNCLRAGAGYKARPLNGIWATAPFLHNGSVPTLHDLLLPVAERPKLFYLGHLEFDPLKVGYLSSEAKGLSKVDTSKAGSLNTGHEYGTTLDASQRQALLEYLKTL